MRINHFRSFFVRTSVLVFVAAGAFILGSSRIHVEWPSQAQAQKSLWNEKSETEKNPTGATLDVSSLNKTFVDLAKNLSPSVVNIFTESRVGGSRGRMGRPGGPGQLDPDDILRYFFGNPFGGEMGPPRQQQAMGSGFVINNEGLIVTNSHVVRSRGKDADTIMVKFIDDSARSKGHEATVLGVDEGTDVAVLKLKNPRKGIISSSLGNSDKTQVGEWVVAIGNPYGHTHSVTKGIVSALGRSLEASRADFIQTDASINPGNSGGPLFNLSGEVIGINTAIDARAQGIGFAIPINTAKNVIRQIIEKGSVTLGWVGVTIAELTPQIASSLGIDEIDGVLIQDVLPGEPADRAGLKSYDIVTQVNGKTIATGRDFLVNVGNLPIGKEASFKILRDGKSKTLGVVVAKRKSESELAKRYSPEQGSPRGKVAVTSGLVLSDLSPETRRRSEVPGSVIGVLVERVLPGTPAAAALLNPGDVIVEINRKPIRSAREAESALSVRADSFLLKVQRRSASIIVFLDMSRQDEAADE
jgi:serine protease Do